MWVSNFIINNNTYTYFYAVEKWYILFFLLENIFLSHILLLNEIFDHFPKSICYFRMEMKTLQAFHKMPSCRLYECNWTDFMISVHTPSFYHSCLPVSTCMYQARSGNFHQSVLSDSQPSIIHERRISITVVQLRRIFRTVNAPM